MDSFLFSITLPCVNRESIVMFCLLARSNSLGLVHVIDDFFHNGNKHHAVMSLFNLIYFLLLSFCGPAQILGFIIPP